MLLRCCRAWWWADTPNRQDDGTGLKVTPESARRFDSVTLHQFKGLGRKPVFPSIRKAEYFAVIRADGQPDDSDRIKINI